MNIVFFNHFNSSILYFLKLSPIFDDLRKCNKWPQDYRTNFVSCFHCHRHISSNIGNVYLIKVSQFRLQCSQKMEKKSTLQLWNLKLNCFCSFFGRIEDTKKTFRNILTFSSVQSYRINIYREQRYEYDRENFDTKLLL